MKLNANERYELKAKAFEKMRFMLAPGKDKMYGPERKVREKEWYEWNDKYGKVCEHLLEAVEDLIDA